MESRGRHLKFDEYGWEFTKKIEYKADGLGNTFYQVTRQNIIGMQDGVGFETRYFECGRGGYTTLEKHEHVHIVMALRGHGKAIIGQEVYELKPYDFVIVPPWTPHQFINTSIKAFGFICCVNVCRDKYTLLTEEEVNQLHHIKDVHEYIKIPEGYFKNRPSFKE